MKKKTMLILSATALVLAAGAAYWWFAIRHTHTAPPVVVSRSITLPEFTLSVARSGGMSSYLVLGLAAEIKGPSALAKGWTKVHNTEVRAAVLSSLLDMKNLRQVNTRKTVRALIRKNVSTDLDRILHRGNNAYSVKHVYITKLILQ